MNDRYDEIEIGEISEHIRNGLSVKQSKEKNGLPITRIETIWNEVIDPDRVGYAGIKAGEKGGWLLKAGDILISHINSKTHLGKCALYAGFPEKLIHGMNLLCLRPKNQKVVPNYLIRVLQSPQFRSRIPSITKDSVNQSSFHVSNFKRLTIPLPPLAEQKRIAAILDKADAIRRKRRQAIQLADEFLRSVFLDMFGDPTTNPKGWQKKKIRKLGKVVTGNTPSRQIPENYGDHIEWIKSDNINTPSHILTRAKEALSVVGEKLGRTVPANSTLVTCIAGTPECIGNAALTDRKVAFNQQINAIVPFDNIDPYFLYMLVTISKRIIQKASTNSMKGMVSKGIFQEIELIFPPYNLQKKFGSYFYAYLNYLDKQELQLKESDNLFNSLCQKAFRGEL